MSVISLAIIKLAFITFFGFVLYKKKVVSDQNVKFLTSFVINFSVPFLIFSHLTKKSNLVLSYSLWHYLGMSAAIFLVGYIFALIISKVGVGDNKKELTALVSFQNAGYLPMNIVFFLFKGALREQFLVYIFLYLLGFNILMWSLGSFFIFRKEKQAFKIKTLFTPPVISTLVALIFVYCGFSKFIPNFVLEPVSMVVNLSFVLSMMILGCWLAKANRKYFKKQLPSLVEVTVLKLFAVPLVVICFLIYFKVPSGLGFFILLQAAMPSAASLPIVAEMHDADSGFISQGVFLTHVFSIITIPLWLALGEAIGCCLSGG